MLIPQIAPLQDGDQKKLASPQKELQNRKFAFPKLGLDHLEFAESSLKPNNQGSIIIYNVCHCKTEPVESGRRFGKFPIFLHEGDFFRNGPN